MTVEAFTPADTYIVAGTGPYAIPHPYSAGTIRVLVTVGGVEVALGSGDFSVSPTAAAVSGDVFLTGPAAATHAGRVLRIERDTNAEQGWLGVQGEREKGLEVQLDQLTYALQDVRALGQRSLRTRDPIPVFVPVADRVLMFDGAAIVAGPTAAEITAAEGHAQAAAASAAQAAIYFEGIWLDSPTAVIGNTTLGYSAPAANLVISGDYIRTRDGHAYTVAASGATDHHLTTAGGVKLYVVPEAVGFNVRAFGARGDGVNDDTAECQAAINAVVARGRGVVWFPAGFYLLSATLSVPAPTVSAYSAVLKGAGHGATTLYRTTNYGDTIRLSTSSTTLPMVDSGVEGFVFYHDTRVGVPGITGMTSGAAVMMHGVVRGAIRDCYAINHYDGFNIQGGSSIHGEHLYVVGYNGVSGINGVTNTGLKIWSLPAGAPAGTVPLPSKIVIAHFGMGGVPNLAANHCIHIGGGEQIELQNCEASGAKINNLLIQPINNSLILETLVYGGYYDTCDAASIWIGDPAGDGSVYIGNTIIKGAIVKASGFGAAYDGIYVDGTVRGGAYAQAAQGLQIEGCNINAFIRHGINLVGGRGVTIADNIIRGNDYANAGGSGLVVGANARAVLIDGNMIGGQPASDGTGFQDYGVWIVGGATKITVINNDLRGNVIAPILDLSAEAATSQKRIFNNLGFNENRAATSPAMPASGVDLFNPIGSPCWVSITGGTVSDIKLNGQTIAASTPLQFQLGFGDRVRVTYTVPPNWVWWPQ